MFVPPTGGHTSLPPSMARPVNANAEQTKHNILAAASELFSDNGFEGASVRQIAQAAGVSLGMIRHYFGSKEGLYKACISVAYEILGQLGGQIAQGLAGGGNVEQVVGEAVRGGFQFALTNRPAFKLMLWELMTRESWRSDMGDREMIPFILSVARGLASHLGRPIAELVLVARTLIFLVVRYATAHHDEVAFLLSNGRSRAKATKRTTQAIEDHLVDTTIRLLKTAS